MLICFFPTFGPQVEGGDVQGARGSDGSGKEHLQLFWTEEATRSS